MIIWNPGWKERALKQINSTCNRCGTCCQDVPIVDVYPWDIYRLAKHFHVSSAAIMIRYLDEHPKKDGRFTLKTLMPCMFFDSHGNRCRVHASRPTICRMYPFLAGKRVYCDPKVDFEDLDDEETFKKLMKSTKLGELDLKKYLYYIGAIKR